LSSGSGANGRVGLDYRIVTVHSVRAEIIRMIDLQDRVFLHDTKEQQETQTGKDIYVWPNTRRLKIPNGIDSGSVSKIVHRMDERLELCRQHDIHKNERQMKARRK
jgi:hypothetical protein